MTSTASARARLEPTLQLLRTELERRQPGDTMGVHAMSWQALLPPGKLLRPALFLSAAAAVGMPCADAVAAALSVEYLHVGSLVHDDVIDGDVLRRGRQSVVARYGTANAIVTGDALMMATFQTLAEHTGVPDGRLLAVVRTLAQAGMDLCRGQAMENSLHADLDCGLDRYREMISLKTGALFRGACLGGVLLAGGSDREQAAARRYSERLGAAFQMADDLLLLSDAAASGKSPLGDLNNNRPTFPLLVCWQIAGQAARQRLAEAVSGALAADEALANVRELLDSSGALEQCRAEARAQAVLAKRALRILRAGPGRDALAAVADLAVDRTQ
ncbi:polyprenyl synthetase family protein [Streptomyces decoyicus]